jgi:hypothetical protein
LLDDLRADESWPERLQAAEILLNARDPTASRRAIETALAALDYGAEPWYGPTDLVKQVRSRAATLLGRLDPVYRDDGLFDRLARVLAEDEQDAVRDAAYRTLLRLAAAPDVEATSASPSAAPPS